MVEITRSLLDAVKSSFHPQKRVEIQYSPSSELQKKYKAMRPMIAESYREAEEWHGTGRYRYGKDGQVIDLLEHIVTSGLSPQEDDWDGTLGQTHSISLTQQRMYAGVYADMFQKKGDELQYRFHDYYYWGARFMRTIVKKKLWSILRHFPFKKFSKRSQQWPSKITNEPINPLDPLSARSDIEGNYSILTGIKEGSWTPVPVAPYVSIFEQRSSTTIPPTGLTHIEVPLKYVERTEAFLKEKESNIKVLPRELGEMYASELPERALVNRNPFRENK